MSIIFGGRRPTPAAAPTDKPDTIIGPATQFNGDLKTEGALRIDGVVEGSVVATGNVIVGKNGRVMARITGQNVLVAGVVQGDIVAAGRLEIISSGRVIGDINARVLLI